MKSQFLITLLYIASYGSDAKSIYSTNEERTNSISEKPITENLQPPECLNHHPQCCKDIYTLEKCPRQICNLPLCNDQNVYSDDLSPKKKNGEECGPCLSQHENCGVCEDGLECVKDQEHPYFPEARSKCRISSYGPPSTNTSVNTTYTNDMKEAIINPDGLGNIPNDPNYHWKEQIDHEYNKCFPRFEIKFRDKCDEYEEEECYTKHEEQCDIMTFQNCGLVPKETHERKCEEVNEQICHLRRSYKTEQVLDYEPKSKCHHSTRRICDTVWQFDHSTNDEFICKKVSRPKCTKRWKIIYEKTCKSTYRFDCRGGGSIQSNGNWVLNSLHQVHGYGNGMQNQDRENHTANKYSNEDFDNFRCQRIPVKRCYTTPRRVRSHKCEQAEEQKCQKVTNRTPRPVQHQSCHDEPYEECEVESQQHPKIMQIPVYTEDCRAMPREICDNQGKTTLEVKCVNEIKPVCKWKPKAEQCHKTPRKHCYKVPYQEKTTDCDESYQQNLVTYEPEMEYTGMTDKDLSGSHTM